MYLKEQTRILVSSRFDSYIKVSTGKLITREKSFVPSQWIVEYGRSTYVKFKTSVRTYPGVLLYTLSIYNAKKKHQFMDFVHVQKNGSRFLLY